MRSNDHLNLNHNLDFFVAFTPDTGSSDKRKSGYLKPDPGFDKAVRQAAPSTGNPGSVSRSYRMSSGTDSPTRVCPLMKLPALENKNTVASAISLT